MKLRRLFLEDDDKLIKIKSWRPIWDNGLWWPTMLVDVSGSIRTTIMPGWNLARFKHALGIKEPAEKPVLNCDTSTSTRRHYRGSTAS